MITIDNANKILKTVYLDVMANHLNYKTNAFYNKVKMGSEHVEGNEIHCLGRYGVHGGIGGGTDDSDLPIAGGNNYIKYKAFLSNIFGSIEISDKLLRVANGNAGSLVNILNAEMEGLLESAKFNFSRMLFQDGSGTLCKIGDLFDNNSNVRFPVSSIKMVMEGMIIDIVGTNGRKVHGAKIVSVNRDERTITISPAVPSGVTIAEGDVVTLQNSYKSELYGLGYLFNKDESSFYGLNRSECGHILPNYLTTDNITPDVLQQMLDVIDERSGNEIDLIISSYDVRRNYFNNLAATRTNIDYMNLDGGFKAICYNGIPIVADRFAPDGKMYFVNTDDFRLQQLGDWSWIETNDGNVLRQVDNKAAFAATLVKYANLMCLKPVGQGELTLEVDGNVDLGEIEF